ncbi:hypothetical protein HK100_002880 [Physocladia obscura]|uniref:Small ribosomal subunit protein bS18m n=1 Tax=Physocladia obscura TaxID=109957 RepID=A0AAD5XDW9_9FUNG|nr:hypothetical protein HK100_002880 [Physocladia obscura]
MYKVKLTTALGPALRAIPTNTANTATRAIYSYASGDSSPVYSGANIDSDFQVLGNLPVKRLFKPYQTYEPAELNQKTAEFRFKVQEKEPKIDIFAALNVNPLDLYKNVKLLSHFVTDMGHIKPRTQTGLGIVNQKRISKAIKRAQAIGKGPKGERD